MTTVQALIAFTLAAALLTITPGLDTVLVLRTAAAEGARRAALAALGVCTGCLTWGAAVALGLGTLLAASQLAYEILQWAGAIYLGYLGIRLIVKPRSEIARVPDAAAPPAGGNWFWAGLLSNLLNPKIGVFYVSFLPQFVPAGVAVAGFTFMLAAIHVLLGLIWFAALIAATQSLGRALRRPGLLRAMDRLTGCVFLAFGVKLAVSGR